MTTDVEMVDTERTELPPYNPVYILQIVKEAQQQHGLRHGDYNRYRKYCTAKLGRLRKALKFTNTHNCVKKRKAKFVQKRLTEENFTDPALLLIGIFEVERRYALAMTEKMTLEDNPDKLRKKFAMTRSLRRAVFHASNLEKLIVSSPRCDAPSKLEAQAYSAWAKGMCAFESRDWNVASEALKVAKTVYDKLAEATNNTTLSNLYKAKCREIQPQLRLCEFNCAESPEAVGTVSELMELRMQIGEGGDSTIDKLISEMRSTASGTETVTVEWAGMKNTVEDEKARQVVHAWNHIEAELAQCNSAKEKIALYEKQVSDTRDAIEKVSDIIRRKSAENSDSTVLQSIKSYLELLKMNGTSSRYLAIIESTKSEKKSKPQDLLRLYDSVIAILTEVAEIPGAEFDKTLLETFEARVEYYRAFRCFYMASSYAALGKYAEATALNNRCIQRVQQVSKSIGKLEKSQYGRDESQTALNKLKEEVEQANVTFKAARLAQATGQLVVDDKQAKVLDDRTLLETLDEWREWKVKESLRDKKTIPVAKLPPSFIPMPNKPIFFDLANFHLSMPNLDARLEKLQKEREAAGVKSQAKVAGKGKQGTAQSAQTTEEEEKGISGMVKGWFWGKK